MTSPTEASRDLATALVGPAAAGLAVRRATVNTVNADGTVDLDWPTGGVVQAVPRLASYILPAAGDVVTVLVTAGSPLVVGSTTATATPGWRMYHGNGQSITSAGYPGTIYVGSSVETHGGVTASSGVMTIPAGGGGRYACTFHASLSAGTSTQTGTRIARIEKLVSSSLVEFAEGERIVPDNRGTDQTRIAVSSLFNANAGDQFQARLYQNSGVTLNVVHTGNYAFTMFAGTRVAEPTWP